MRRRLVFESFPTLSFITRIWYEIKNNKKDHPLRSFTLIGLMTFLLTGCMVGPDFETPPPPQTQGYTETELPEKTRATEGPGGHAQEFVCGRDIPAAWWELFHSEPLNELIQKALKNNPTLQGAQAALAQAEANLDFSISELLPTVTAKATPERQRFNPIVFDERLTPKTFNLYNVSVNVAYTLDVFGGIRRQIEASQAQMEAQQFEVEATYLTLTANVVTAAITEASLRAQIKATEDLIAAQSKVLEITKKKFNLGGSSRLDIVAQEAQLAQTQASLPLLNLDLAKVRNSLSVLIGEFPSESCLPTFHLEDLTLPPELPVSIPAYLVQQRPDIRAAEALLHSASAQIGVATANLFPQVNITGTNYGWIARKMENLFTQRSVYWELLANIAQPIFDGGALVSQRDASLAAFEKASAQYKQTVLQGFQNVADSLKALELDAEFLHVQTNAEKAASQTLTLTNTQYTLGALEYVTLLVADREYHTARIERIKALASRYKDTVALFQSLGGGWWNRPPCKG
jgi:NodT family efflux transporter outer membrane factor (OMF) lipoprotein